jgi:hypothetical protein
VNFIDEEGRSTLTQKKLKLKLKCKGKLKKILSFLLSFFLSSLRVLEMKLIVFPLKRTTPFV